ncbi:MAG: chemotaxis protein [Massilia sp.]|jgi:chemotaxis-related protein WspB|nr:chemotaxis protein [Massilia sp.]
MKVLAFTIGADRYGLPLQAVARVLPAMALKLIPGAPDFVAGLMDLHGTPVPVLDVSRLAGLVVEQVWLDSRIVLIDYVIDHMSEHTADSGATRQLGLLVEHVAGIENVADAALQDPGIDGAPFLGPVAASLQIVDVAQLLAPDVRALLFPRDAVPATGALA